MGRTPQIDWDQFRALTLGLAEDVRESGWMPEAVVGLQSGGYFVAVTLAKLLGVTCMPGIDVYKDDQGVRSLSGAVKFNPHFLWGKRVLGVDDTVIGGTLTRLLREAALGQGECGEFRMATLVGVGPFPADQVHYVGCRMATTPVMPWAWLMQQP